VVQNTSGKPPNPPNMRCSTWFPKRWSRRYLAGKHKQAATRMWAARRSDRLKRPSANMPAPIAS